MRDVLFYKNQESERGHRKYAPDSIRHGITITVAARLFTVSNLLDGWKEPDKWQVEHILDIRNECLYAQAYAKRHYEELRAWAEKWTPVFAEVDYAELQK